MRRYDTKPTDPFYRSPAWRRLRVMALQRDHYLCRRCRKRPATTVHHLMPREQYPDLALMLDNLESICARCHNQEHPEKGRRGQAAEALEGIRVIEIN